MNFSFRNLRGNKTLKLVFIFTLLLFFLLLPTFLTSYLLHVMIIILLYVYLGSCWDILGGYCGQTSFGHASFLGIGAYTSTLLLLKLNLSPWFGMIIGGVIGMLCGLFIGFLCFRYRIRESYFALVMLTFAEVIRLLFLNWKLVGGASGLLIPLKENSLYYFQFDNKLPYYYIILLMSFFILLFNNKLINSKLGDFFVALRENEETAESIGINTTKYKLVGIALSSLFTAFGGTFYAQYLTYIDPDLTFGVGLSIEILLRPLLGGSGTLFGPTFGAFILGPLSELTRSLMHGYSGVHLMIYGLLIIAVILFFPGGISSLLKNIMKRLG